MNRVIDTPSLSLGIEEIQRTITNNDTITIVIIVITAIISTLLSIAFGYIVAFIIRLKKREQMSIDMTTIEVRVSKDNEVKIDAAEQMFNSLSSLKKSGFFSFLEVENILAFEIFARKGEIRFYVSAPRKILDYVEKIVYGYYPNADIQHNPDQNIFHEKAHVVFANLVQKKEPYYPLKVYRDIPGDPLAAITSALSRMDDGEGAAIQILIRPTKPTWKKDGKSYISSTKKDEANPEKATYKVDQKTLEKIDDKCSRSGFDTIIRVVASSPNKSQAKAHLSNIKGTFTQFTSDLNKIGTARQFFKGGFMINFTYKFFPILQPPFFKTVSIFSTDELASMFHLPNKTIETPFIQWVKARTAPISSEIPTREGTFIGFGVHRGQKRPVCIGHKDRMRHTYIIGKTGTGKSELLIELIKQDIEAGKGVCVIDPHGDLVEDVLRFIPPQRAEDVIYFDPADTERPMGLNLLEAQTEEQKHFITSAIINLMYKLYDPQRTGIIGPRFEHAVRNAMLTIMVDPGATFVEIVRIMTDQKFVQELLPRLDDPVVKRYWTDQIAQTHDFHKSEVLDYIVSKFGRFVTNKMMRNIIGQSKSAFDFRKVMDDGKILLINLSKGKLGEENSTFLGLLIVPKILAAAMSRVDTPQDQRRDFFLYVDEFQNFATPDFAVILSEARKYKLALTVANQFIGQMDEEVKNAVFGNVGTIMTLRVGEQDANFLQRIYQPTFNENDLINQARFSGYMKTIVNNEPVPPFSVDMTKDVEKLNKLRNEKLAQAIIQLSRLKFGRPQELVNSEITQRAKL